MKPLVLILSLAFSLSGCGLMQQYMYEQQPLASESTKPEIQPELALVHFYRVGNRYAGKIGTVNIYANDQDIFGVKNKGYSWFYLEPGNYQFKAKWSVMDKPLFEGGLYDEKLLTLNLEKGKEYFVNYKVSEVASSSYDEASKVIGIAAKIAEPRSPEASVELVTETREIAIQNINQCIIQTNEINKKI
jgi:hypothetical protein